MNINLNIATKQEIRDYIELVRFRMKLYLSVAVGFGLSTVLLVWATWQMAAALTNNCIG